MNAQSEGMTVPDDDRASREHRYRESGEWAGETIPTAFRRSAVTFPDKDAIVTLDGALTYRELDERSDAFALSLVDEGVPVGSSVLFQMGNELETVVAFYGTIKAGLVPICSIPNHRVHEASLIAAAADAKVHLFQDDYRGYDLRSLSSELATRCPNLGLRIVSRGEATSGERSFASMSAVTDPERARRVVDELDEGVSSESHAVFQLSSGTTGVPKVIPHTHDSYLSIASRWSSNLRWDDSNVNLHFIPVMHHAGLGTALVPGHFVGGTVVLLRVLDAETLASMIERHRVTWMHFNLAALRPLLEYSASADCDFSSLTHVTWGHVRPELSAQAEKMLGCVAVGSFGMGEGVHLSARRDDPEEIRLQTCGSVIGPYDEVEVRDPDNGEVLPDGFVGELTFRGPSVVDSYLSAEDTAASFTSDGFLRSGDLGRVQMVAGRRCFTVDGRLKDQISRGGEKFMAAELEALLGSHADVREVAALGVPDPILGERVCVAVVPTSQAATVDSEELRRRLVDHLDGLGVAKFKWPERIAVVESFPKTGIGKVRKDELRAQVLADGPS